MSGVVLAAVPRFGKCHVVAGFHGYPPCGIVLFRFSWDKAESRTESTNPEGLDLDAGEGDLPQLVQPGVVCRATRRMVHPSSGTEGIDPGFQEPAVGLEEVQGDELLAVVPNADGGLEGGGQEELP